MTEVHPLKIKVTASRQTFLNFPQIQYVIRHGLGVRIAGSHPAGPGSIPGVGIPF